MVTRGKVHIHVVWLRWTWDDSLGFDRSDRTSQQDEDPPAENNDVLKGHRFGHLITRSMWYEELGFPFLFFYYLDSLWSKQRKKLTHNKKYCSKTFSLHIPDMDLFPVVAVFVSLKVRFRTATKRRDG